MIYSYIHFPANALTLFFFMPIGFQGLACALGPVSFMNADVHRH